MSDATSSYVSVTDLQKQTKKALWNINRIKRKVILLNNKPHAMLLSLNEFNELTNSAWMPPYAFPDKWEREAIAEYEKNPNKWDWIDADVFFKDLLNKADV